MVADLHAVCDAVESGVRWSGSRFYPDPWEEASTPSPDEIRAIRGSLGLSQARFAEFLGAGLTTVRSWELGEREPSSLARRLLGAIRDDPASMGRTRLAKEAGTTGSPPARRGG